MKVSSQKLHAILKRAGFRKSEYHRSHVIRGCGERTTGYQIQQGTTRWIVSHSCGYHRMDHDAMRLNVGLYRRAIFEAGIGCEVSADGLDLYVPKGDS